MGDKKNEIMGDSETADSLIYMREKLDYLDKNLNQILAKKRFKNQEIHIDIFEKEGNSRVL